MSLLNIAFGEDVACSLHGHACGVACGAAFANQLRAPSRPGRGARDSHDHATRGHATGSDLSPDVVQPLGPTQL
eukprot:5751375-Prymnesium_polylepis.1